MYVRVVLHHSRTAVVSCKSEFYLYYDLYLLCDIVLLLMKNVLSMMIIFLWIVKEYNLKYGTIIIVMNVLIHKNKKFKAYYGFRVPYVFPFPSAGHEPIGSGRDKRIIFFLFYFIYCRTWYIYVTLQHYEHKIIVVYFNIKC